MRGDILQVHKPQIRRPGNGVADGSDRGNTAARKNIPFDEIHRSLVAIEYLIPDRYCLKRHHAVRFQQPAGPDVTANYMLVTALFENMRQVPRALLQKGVDTKHLYMRDCSGMLDPSSDTRCSSTQPCK